MHIPLIETKPLDQIKKLQEEKLVELLNYLRQNSKFYKQHFHKHLIDIDHIKTLEDITRIPVTNKDDLQNSTDDFL